VEAGVISQSDSPWATRTKFSRKKNDKLRMVHVFCPINTATIKSDYPMKFIEPILKRIAQPQLEVLFQANTS
jgi:hypothetical protein